MYARLEFDLSRTDTKWKAVYFALPGAAKQLDPADDQRRKLSAAILVKAECPQLDPSQRDAQAQQVYGAVKFIPKGLDTTSFELYMALAHFSLDPADRARREAHITELLRPDFTSLGHDFVAAHGRKLEAMAVLVPDAALGVVARTQVAHLHKSLLLIPHPQTGANAAQVVFKQLCERSGWAETSDLASALLMGCFGVALADRPRCLALMLQQLEARTLQVWLPVLLKALVACERDILIGDQADAIFCALQAADTVAPPATEDLVANAVDQFVARRAARCHCIVEATRAAIEAGVRFDGPTASKNAVALNAYEVVTSRCELALTVKRLRKALDPTPQPIASPQTGADPADLDPIHARSVEWLVNWIQDADAAPGGPVRIDRKKVVAQEHAIRERARRAARLSPDKMSHDVDMNEADVGLVVRSGLCSSAEFFLGHLHDMTLRAKQLGADPALLADGVALVAPLQALGRDALADEQQALALLGRAELAVETLRANIRAVEVEGRVRQRFLSELAHALGRERLVYGKRHGGVINCPMRQRDWPWVNAGFHQRWLGVQCLEIDTLAVPLKPHQALALYVTGSSLSNHAFDISVHLWVRKADGKSLPNTDTGPYPRMNTAEWRDTHIPCAVLHVPSAD